MVCCGHQVAKRKVSHDGNVDITDKIVICHRLDLKNVVDVMSFKYFVCVFVHSDTCNVVVSSKPDACVTVGGKRELTNN